MRRAFGWCVVVLHAAFFLTTLVSYLYPLWLQTAMMAFVALPAIVLRGRCWVTGLERRLLSQPRLPSMTIRLVRWLSLGRIELDRRSQWAVIGGVPLILWLPRVLVWLIAS